MGSVHWKNPNSPSAYWELVLKGEIWGSSLQCTISLWVSFGWLERRESGGVQGRGTEESLEKLGVDFNTTLPGKAQRARGTRVCDRERKGVFRQKELRHTRSGNTKYTGLELEGHWEEGPASRGHGQCGSCRTVGQGTL